MNDSDMALMLAMRLASLTWLKRSWVESSCPKAWMTRTPAISSARSPTTLATRVRVSRKAVRARRENQMVTRIIKRQHGEGEQRQARAHVEHDDDDAAQHQGIADQGDDALREQLVDRRDIVHHPRDGHADDVGVVVAQREPLQVVEQVAAQVGEHALPDPGEVDTAGRRWRRTAR